MLRAWLLTRYYRYFMYTFQNTLLSVTSVLMVPCSVILLQLWPSMFVIPIILTVFHHLSITLSLFFSLPTTLISDNLSYIFLFPSLLPFAPFSYFCSFMSLSIICPFSFSLSHLLLISHLSFLSFPSLCLHIFLLMSHPSFLCFSHTPFLSQFFSPSVLSHIMLLPLM